MNKKYAVADYKSLEIDDKVVIITYYGDWVALSKEHYSDFINKNMDKKLESFLIKKGILITDSNINEIKSRYRKSKGQLYQGASLHIIYVSRRCNLKCTYCHASPRACDEPQFDMDVKTAKATVDFIFKSSSRIITIEFQGGEPLLNFDAVEFIVEYAKEKSKSTGKELRMSLVTNLTLTNDQMFEFLVKNNVEINISLDGPKHVHDKNRILASGMGSYNKLKELILKYNKNGKLKALMTTTRASLPYYKEIIDEYVRFGFENIFIRPLYKLSFADENWDRVGYSAEEYFRFWKNSLNYIWDKKEISEPFSQMLLKKILSENKPMYVDLMSPCGAGIKVVAYDFNGDIYSCDKALITGEDIFKLGNTRENTYKYTFQNKSKMAPIIESSINDLWYCKKCAFQPFCGVCPVLNYNLTGKLEPGETPDDRCKILFMQFSYLLKKVLGDQEIYKDIKKRDNSIPPYEEFVFDHKA